MSLDKLTLLHGHRVVALSREFYREQEALEIQRSNELQKVPDEFFWLSSFVASRFPAQWARPHEHHPSA